MEFPRAFNEEPRNLFTHASPAAAPRWLLAPRLRRIMAGRNSRRSGGCPMPAKKLTDAEISALLPKAKGWSVANGKLHKEFGCKDFVTAFGNMTRVALVAEAMNHHPEWFNVWNKVVIDLNTHSVKGISDYDFVLAEKINEIFGA
jgi:4a-hydroxytetrahydrobiopterin dehydratase